MTPHPRARSLLVVTAALVLMLTGCSAGAARPVSSSRTQTGASAPKPTVDASAGPGRVKPPSSEAEAIADANSSLLGYYTASFTSGHAGGTRLDLISPWAAGPALRNEQLLAEYLGQKHYRLDGTPTQWTLNASRSSAAQSKEANSGVAISYGAVRLVGCAGSTNHPVGDGAPVWATRGQKFSRIWSVLYDAQRQHWLVTAAVPVTKAEEDAAPCD